MSLTAIRNLLKGFVILKNNGSAVNSIDRKNLNIIPGTNISLTAVDNSLFDQVDVTINATGGSSAKEKRSDWVSPYSYCGTAPLGSAEAASVWLIYRITCYDDGTVLVQSASAVNWTNRYTHTYT